MAMQPKAWMTAIFFEKWISHFITFIQACKYNLNTSKYHLLVLDGHNSHVITNVVYKKRHVGIGFDYFALSHQPCFITF
jgi:hypothetical protein